MSPKRHSPIDPQVFLAKVSEGKRLLACRKDDTVFSQGDPADAVFYIQRGRVKLTVVSSRGKEAIVGMLRESDFFGEGCLAGQFLRMATATALVDCSLMRITKKAMLRALQNHPPFSKFFLAYLLRHSVRIEEDLVDQLLNSSEKRLARLLLLLAQYGQEGKPISVLPKISQEVLAEMIGTTRSRVSFFMNKFRKLGFIEYDGGLHVHSSLINVVLHD